MEEKKNIFKSILRYVPGILCAAVIAVVSQLAADAIPVHLISASVIALFIGMGINAVVKKGDILSPGTTFTSKKLLKFAIVLLGASMSINTVLQVGAMSLIIMIFTLATCFGVGYFTGRALGLNWKMSNLISAGTGICGGSAIAAIAPVIGATNLDIAFAMSATFIFDMVMIVLFPYMGHALGLSDVAYGLWSGTAVNDTSSVVAAGYAFSEAAGEFAVMVKLTRTLSIIPVVIRSRFSPVGAYFAFVLLTGSYWLLMALIVMLAAFAKNAQVGLSVTMVIQLLPWIVNTFTTLQESTWFPVYYSDIFMLKYATSGVETFWQCAVAFFMANVLLVIMMRLCIRKSPLFADSTYRQ